MSFADLLKPTMSDFQLKVTANDSILKKKKERTNVRFADISYEGDRKSSVRIKRKRKKFKNELNVYWNERDLIFSRKWWMQFEKRMSVPGYFVGEEIKKKSQNELSA